MRDRQALRGIRGLTRAGRCTTGVGAAARDAAALALFLMSFSWWLTMGEKMSDRVIKSKMLSYGLVELVQFSSCRYGIKIKGKLEYSYYDSLDAAQAKFNSLW